MQGKPRSSQAAARFAWLVLGFIGLVCWISLTSTGDSARGWRALLVAFLFFSPLAAGLICWSAVLLWSDAKWVWPWIGCAEGALGFALPSVFTLAALWWTHAQWAPWGGQTFSQGFWLNPHFLFGRDLASLIVFWILAHAFVARLRLGGGRRLAVWVILAFGWVFSLIGFDLAAALDPRWYSSLFGGYFFISALYGAVTLWTFMILLRGRPPARVMRDFGGLIVAFSLLTTAMLYSQLLPIWYANLRQEVRFLIARWNFPPWNVVSVLLLCTIYLGPLVFLLTARAKTTRWYLGTVSAVLLFFLWIERLWLVVPVFEPRRLLIGPVEVAIAAAFSGIFGYVITAVDDGAAAGQGEPGPTESGGDRHGL